IFFTFIFLLLWVGDVKPAIPMVTSAPVPNWTNSRRLMPDRFCLSPFIFNILECGLKCTRLLMTKAGCHYPPLIAPASGNKPHVFLLDSEFPKARFCGQPISWHG